MAISSLTAAFISVFVCHHTCSEPHTHTMNHSVNSSVIYTAAMEFSHSSTHIRISCVQTDCAQLWNQPQDSVILLVRASWVLGCWLMENGAGCTYFARELGKRTLGQTLQWRRNFTTCSFYQNILSKYKERLEPPLLAEWVQVGRGEGMEVRIKSLIDAAGHHKARRTQGRDVEGKILQAGWGRKICGTVGRVQLLM